MCGSSISEVALQKFHQHNRTSAKSTSASAHNEYRKQYFGTNKVFDLIELLMPNMGHPVDHWWNFVRNDVTIFVFVYSVSCDSLAIIISLQWLDCIRELQHGDNNIHLLMWEMMNTNGALSVYMRSFLWKLIFQIAYSRHCLVRMKHHPFILSKQLILNILHINENLQM